jgi:hypothetical protein
MSKDPIDVSEKLGVYLNPKTNTRDIREFAKELEADFKKFEHQNYDHFSVVLALEDGKPILNLVGYRKENPDETKKRLAIEEQKQKKAEEVELKEYLRLKNKYGKKNE